MGSQEGQSSHFGPISPDLSDRKQFRAFAESHGLLAKKRLGQHWLQSGRVADAIIEAALPASSFLEIGPGVGVLTQRLSLVARTVAVELDDSLLIALREAAPAAEIVHANFLRVDLETLLSSLDRPISVVGNLPYAISSPILDILDRHSAGFDKAVIMIQKEVAEKICAPVGVSNRGALSVIMQLRFDIAKVTSVRPVAFVPPPKVDSMVLSLIPRSGDELSEWERSFIRAGFQSPRKTLLNNLAARFGKEIAHEAFQVAGFPLKIRPQVLTCEEWISLASRFRIRGR